MDLLSHVRSEDSANRAAQHTRCQRNKEHEERAFWVSIPNCGRDGGEPFLWVAVVLVLYDLMIMEGDAYDEGAYEGSYTTTLSAIDLLYSE